MDFQRIFDNAHAAGCEAAKNCTPAPMLVSGYAPIADGVCGFAWVNWPGNTAWGRWTKKEGIARKDYPSGLCYWISDYGQSMTRKAAYARAFANSLTAAGIPRVYARSRMD